MKKLGESIYYHKVDNLLKMKTYYNGKKYMLYIITVTYFQCLTWHALDIIYN